MNTDALIWIIIVAVTGVGANIVTIIVAFRRQPPLHQEYATKVESREHHAWDVDQHQVLHDRIDRLKGATIAKDTYEAAEATRLQDRNDIKNKLDELLQRTAHLVGYGDHKR